jgi:predicted HTH transcriptional regulator
LISGQNNQGISMDFREIKALVKGGESDSLEFKRKASFPEKIVKEIVAFANTRGGNLIIGVDDNGTIPGLRYAEEEAYAMESAIARYCFPRIRYKTETINISDKKSVLHYRIYESRKKPHFVLENNSGGGKKAYIRVRDKSIQASREVIEILKHGKSKKGIQFHFGEKEKLLMQYLDQHEKITVEEYMSHAGIDRHTSSQTLIRLVLASVLAIEPDEEKDYYTLNQSEEQHSK